MAKPDELTTFSAKRGGRKKQAFVVALWVAAGLIILLLVALVALPLWLLYIPSKEPSFPHFAQVELPASKTYAQMLTKELSKIQSESVPWERRIVSLPNTLGADTCVICDYYLPFPDSISKELTDKGIPQATATEIASRMRSARCSFYFLKGEDVVCESEFEPVYLPQNSIVIRVNGDFRLSARIDPNFADIIDRVDRTALPLLISQEP